MCVPYTCIYEEYEKDIILCVAGIIFSHVKAFKSIHKRKYSSMIRFFRVSLHVRMNLRSKLYINVENLSFAMIKLKKLL